MEIREGLTFDDVLLVPKYSNITTRAQTDLRTKLSKNISLNIPLISANMDTVTEAAMAIAMAQEGGIGIIHRFLTVQEEVEEVLKVKRSASVIIEKPYHIGPDQTVKEAISYMHEKGVSGLLVVKDAKLVGILTGRDVMFESASGKLVQDVMTKDIITAKPGISLSEAKETLMQHRIEKLPLVDDAGTVKGLITSKDITHNENYP
ncbi:MAG TPA: IMP dehydrogenase, partial [Candidatus Nitrosotenuis sp.]|nr:IMP dehydrogenase [Candidatus Nitrosotenuis sp.]